MKRIAVVLAIATCVPLVVIAGALIGAAVVAVGLTKLLGDIAMKE